MTTHKRRARAAAPAISDPPALERVALLHLNRFDATVAGLRRVLLTHCRRAGVGDQQAEGLMAPILARYQASGLLDDARYAAAAAHGQRRRGASRRAIERKLALRGVDSSTARQALDDLDQDTPNAELSAAIAFVRKRRLGVHRPAADRERLRRRDLAALARAGFDHETARRALGCEGGDDDEDEYF